MKCNIVIELIQLDDMDAFALHQSLKKVLQTRFGGLKVCITISRDCQAMNMEMEHYHNRKPA